MNLFTRTRTADLGRAPDAMAFSVDIAQVVTKVTGVEILTWSTLFGDPLGTISWSCRVGSLAELTAMTATLNANASYLDKVQEGQDLFQGPMQDQISEIVSVVGTATPGRYTTVISAQCAPGRIGEAMAWAVEAEEESCRLTGLDGIVVRGLYGPFASVGWITPAATIEDVQKGDTAFADPAFAKSIDGAGELFLPGVTHTRLIERLG